MSTSAEPSSLYLDSSAIVKLVITERESAALLGWLARRHDRILVSSGLARTEVRRAVIEADAEVRTAAEDRLRALVLTGVSARMLDDAGSLPPSVVRSLDAIHLTSARRLGKRLEAVVTYDRRMIEAARSLRLTVAHPGLTLG